MQHETMFPLRRNPWWLSLMGGTLGAVLLLVVLPSLIALINSDVRRALGSDWWAPAAFLAVVASIGLRSVVVGSRTVISAEGISQPAFLGGQLTFLPWHRVRKATWLRGAINTMFLHGDDEIISFSAWTFRDSPALWAEIERRVPIGA